MNNAFQMCVGYMTSDEIEVFYSLPKVEFNTYWVPCTWFTTLLREARKSKRIEDAEGVKLIMEVTCIILFNCYIIITIFFFTCFIMISLHNLKVQWSNENVKQLTVRLISLSSILLCIGESRCSGFFSKLSK